MTEEQIAALYRNYGSAVYRRCRALLGTHEEAQDALQEVFMRAMAKGNFRWEASPATWLYRIATNLCLNRLRDRKQVVELQPEHLPLCTSVDKIEARQLLTKLIGRLDSTSTKIAVYHFLDGMSQEEIEEVMGISRRTIGKRLKRIRRLSLELSSAPKERGS